MRIFFKLFYQSESEIAILFKRGHLYAHQFFFAQDVKRVIDFNGQHWQIAVSENNYFLKMGTR